DCARAVAVPPQGRFVAIEVVAPDNVVGGVDHSIAVEVAIEVDLGVDDVGLDLVPTLGKELEGEVPGLTLAEDTRIEQFAQGNRADRREVGGTLQVEFADRV